MSERQPGPPLEATTLKEMRARACERGYADGDKIIMLLNEVESQARHIAALENQEIGLKDCIQNQRYEIDLLRKAINDAIAYCYKFEREHEVGATGPLLPIWQDLQAAVGR